MRHHSYKLNLFIFLATVLSSCMLSAADATMSSTEELSEIPRSVYGDPLNPVFKDMLSRNESLTMDFERFFSSVEDLQMSGNAQAGSNRGFRESDECYQEQVTNWVKFSLLMHSEQYPEALETFIQFGGLEGLSQVLTSTDARFWLMHNILWTLYMTYTHDMCSPLLLDDLLLAKALDDAQIEDGGDQKHVPQNFDYIIALLEQGLVINDRLEEAFLLTQDILTADFIDSGNYSHAVQNALYNLAYINSYMEAPAMAFYDNEILFRLSLSELVKIKGWLVYELRNNNDRNREHHIFA